MPLTAEFYAALESSDEYLTQLHERMWLMDNHKWACWVWEHHFGRSPPEERPSLMHLDYHFDSVDDHSSDPEEVTVLKAETLDQLKQRIATENWIRYDSFIAPALLRGVIKDVHFFCVQGDEWDHGFHHEFLRSIGSRQIFYTSVESVALAELSQPYIVDLCLDLFNNEAEVMDEGDLWSDSEVLNAIGCWEKLIIDAACVTISLSFGCSGTADDTRHLAELVVPKILTMLSTSFPKR